MKLVICGGIHARIRFLLRSFLSVAVLSAAMAQTAPQGSYPGGSWGKATSPEEMGWSSAKLKEAREYSNSIGSAAVMIVVDGLVVDQWGDVDRRYLAHSMRKSFLNSIFGIHVGEGRIDIDATLGELGIDDDDPLTDSEKQATVRDLLRGRSGIYLPGLSLGGSLGNPPRGSSQPGTRYLYNNWDFNALGTIFTQETGREIHAEFAKRIAGPLQMEDFSLQDDPLTFGDHNDNLFTRHAAYPFRISARDLARFGLLYLRNGRWGDTQIVPASWVVESTSPYSIYYADKTRYGYTNWRVYLPGKRLSDGTVLVDPIYWTSGAGAHMLFVVPSANLILVHRVNTDLPLARPSADVVGGLLGRVLQARISDPGPALIEAAKSGDAETVAGLLAFGADPVAYDEQRITPLHWSAERNHTRVVELLLERGGDINAVDMFGRTPLMLAAETGRVSVVRTLLDHGASTDQREVVGETALHWAAARRHTEVVRTLVAAKADVNATGSFHAETALMFAAINDDTESMRILLENGADANARSVTGKSALMLAEALGYDATAAMLEANGARSDDFQLLPLRAYMPRNVVRAVLGQWGWAPDVVRTLLYRGRILNEDGSVLALALRGEAGQIEVLLQKGADKDQPHADGWTPLILAAARGHSSVVEILLEQGADVEMQDTRMGQTALIWAATNGHTDSVRSLIKSGSRLDTRDRFGGTALTRAIDEGRPDIARLLLEAGADVNVRETQNTTPLSIAAEAGRSQLVQVLLDSGAEVDIPTEDGRTALMWAVIGQDTATVEALLAAAADIGIRDPSGETALDMALELELSEITSLLEGAATYGE